MQQILVILWIALYIIGLILIGLIALASLIMLIPFRFEVLATKYEETRVDAKILLANIRLFSYRIWPSRKPKKPKKVKARAKREKRRAAGRPSPAIRIMSRLSMELVAPFIKLVKRLWRSLDLRVSSSGRFGAYDPATTGMVYGAYEAVIRPLDLPETFQPCFDRACLEGRIEVSGRIWLCGLLTDVMLFLFSRPTRQVWMPELRYLVSRR